MSDVVVAQIEDIPAWLNLAGEVEALFGPMVGEPGFQRALQKNIERGTALCIRETDGPPGAALLGGLLFSPKPPRYTIGWLAVAQAYRRRGIGQRLVRHVLDLAETPAEFVVTTFGADNPDGEPARRFYEQLGFHPAEPAAPGPEGGSRQTFRLILDQAGREQNQLPDAVSSSEIGQISP
jgi:ribosomal protein S18 acetylase RimI-like enzyme